jgi:diacylglycerol kinase (ATP)
MDKKIYIVHNPTSGPRGYNQKTIREFVAFLEANQLPYQLNHTTLTENAEVLTARMPSGFTDLVMIGGDGTIHESANGYKKGIPVTIIPAGTGNDFVKNYPVGKTLREQFDVLLRDKYMQVDIGVCNGRKFTNGIGIGFDGQIVEDMNGKKVPFLKGHAKYYYHVLQILASYKDRKFKYTIDGNSNEENLILMTVGNGTTYGGGFNLMPEAKIDDGLFDVCTIGPIPGLVRFLHIGKLSNGTHGKLKAVNFYRATHVTVEANDLLFAHADGERLGRPPFDVHVLPGEMKLRV